MKNVEIKDLVTILKNKIFEIENNLVSLDYILNCNIIGWRQYVSLHKTSYTKKIIYRDSIFEIVIITWLPGQHTKLHDHPSNGCLLKVLYGELYEIRKNEEINESFLKINNRSYMHSSLGKHIISNISKIPAISIHIYSPPNYYNK